MLPPLLPLLLILIVGSYPYLGDASFLRLSPGAVLAVVLGMQALLVLEAYRRRQRLLAAGPVDSATELLYQFGRRLRKLRSLSLVLLALCLFNFGWGELVHDRWRLTGLLAPLAQVIWMLPVVAAWIGFWLLEYPLESLAADQEALAAALEGRKFAPMPPRWAYVLMQLRHAMYLPLVLLLALALRRLAETLLRNWGWGNLAYGAGLAVTLAVLLLAGRLVVWVWSTSKLTAEPLRSRLENMAAAGGVRFTDIRVWHTYHRVVNAAILGPVPMARYFLITDALLARLDDNQIQAVFAHEVGHGHHRHLWWYLAAFAAGGFAAAAAASAGMSLWPRYDTFWQIINYALVAVFLILVFPLISRLCEHQADWYAAQCMAARPQPLATMARDGMTEVKATAAVVAAADQLQESNELNDQADYLGLEVAEAAPPPRLPPLVAGAERFAQALLAVVGLTHRPRDRKGWMHPSISDRVALVRRLARDPQAVKAFDRRQRRLRQWIAASLVVGVVLVVLATLYGR